MAGSKRKEKRDEKRKRRKEEKKFSDQLEDKWVGARTEVFSRITAKEAEIRTKTNEERVKASRIVEDAKGQAAALKRKATLEEIGKDAYDKIVAEAQQEAADVEASTAKDISSVERIGERHMDEAVDFIVKAVISSGNSNA
ncbi:MAG: hypothetical protein SWK76_16710 [Actinomycetota bacterium]|nr:hypothetical protein [Actinomycetota bacterium]